MRFDGKNNEIGFSQKKSWISIILYNDFQAQNDYVGCGFFLYIVSNHMFRNQM